MEERVGEGGWLLGVGGGQISKRDRGSDAERKARTRRKTNEISKEPLVSGVVRELSDPTTADAGWYKKKYIYGQRQTGEADRNALPAHLRKNNLHFTFNAKNKNKKLSQVH